MASRDASKAGEKAAQDQAETPQDATAIPQPIIGIDSEGNERPLSGGSFIRVDGKLVRQEA